MTTHRLSRRSLLRGLAAGASLAALQRLPAQNGKPALPVAKLNDHLSVISGDGGNIGVVKTPDGLLVIDSGLPAFESDLLASLHGWNAPVKTLFNTHHHFDHTGGNVALGKSGAKIMAHENVKARLSTKQFMEAMNRTVEPLAPEGIPTATFAGGGKLDAGTETIAYTHVPAAHTDGDVFLFFPNSNVLHTGDLFFNGFYPVVDYSAKGWVGGMTEGAKTILQTVNAQTKIIPGHGPLATRADLQSFHDMLATITERLGKLAKEGRSVDEAVAAKPTADLDAKWGNGLLKPEMFTRIAYTSVLRRNA